jgi:hypothetical protein
LAQIQTLTRRRSGRRAHIASLGTAAIAGVMATTVAFKVAGSVYEQPAQADMRPSAGPITDVNHVRAAPAAPTPAPTPDTTTGTALGHQQPSGSPVAPPTQVAANLATSGTGETSANTAARAAPDASDATPRPSKATTELARSVPGAAPDAPRSRASGTPNGTSAPEPSRTRRATGTLDIRAKTWADCFLSDGGPERSLGTAPTTVPDLAVGRHRVRCENKAQHKDETVTVTIDATKIAVIEKNW